MHSRLPRGVRPRLEVNSSSVSPESSGSGKAESWASLGFVLPEASLLGVQTAAFPVFSRRQAARGAGGDDTCHQDNPSLPRKIHKEAQIHKHHFAHNCKRLLRSRKLSMGLEETPRQYSLGSGLDLRRILQAGNMTFISRIGKPSSQKARHLPKVTQLSNSSTVVCLTSAFLPP